MNKIKYNKLEIIEEKEENIILIDKTRLVEIPEEFKRQYLTDKEGCGFIERRSNGTFFNKALYLPSMYNWVVGADENGVLCLVPLRKMVE